MSDTSATGTFTAGDMKLISAVFQHLVGDIQTDWDAVATLCGYKDKNVAKTRWGQIKRKKILGSGDAAAAGRKATPRKCGKKAAVEVEEGGNEEGEGDGKGKKGGRKTKKVKTEAVEEEVADGKGQKETRAYI
ncbi:hypothetical protein MBLNU230_g2742t1 [Neophaeotheca triangularis]